MNKKTALPGTMSSIVIVVHIMAIYYLSVNCDGCFRKLWMMVSPEKESSHRYDNNLYLGTNTNMTILVN